VVHGDQTYVTSGWSQSSTSHAVFHKAKSHHRDTSSWASWVTSIGRVNTNRASRVPVRQDAPKLLRTRVPVVTRGVDVAVIGRTTQMSKPALPMCFSMKRKLMPPEPLPMGYPIILKTVHVPNPSPGTTIESKMRWSPQTHSFAIQTIA
jgi:hypothetical protein